MVRLYGDDERPRANVIAWYLERRERVRTALWALTVELLTAGVNVSLELGLVSYVEREAFYGKVQDEEIKMTVYSVDAPQDLRRARVVKRNRGGGSAVQIVPLEYFERASDAWEEPLAAERDLVELVEIRLE